MMNSTKNRRSFSAPMIILIIILLAFGIASCAAKAPASVSGGATLDPAPAAPKQNLIDIINGYKVADPFRALEDADSARAWVDAENQRTEKYLESIRVPGVKERVSELFKIGYVGDQKLAGGKVFYHKLEKGHEQPQLMIRRQGENDRVLVDLETLDTSGKTAMDWYFPSKTGDYIAFGLSKDGSEHSTLYLIDTATGETKADQIPDTRHSSVAWLSDDSGFYYVRYPDDGSLYNRRIYFHALGTDWKNDPKIYGDGREKTDWTEVGISKDDKYLLINVGTGATTSDAYLMERSTGKITTIYEDLGAFLWIEEIRDGKIWGITTHEAPTVRLVRIDPANPAPENWENILAPGELPLENYVIVGDKIVALYKENAASKLVLCDLNGKTVEDIALPSAGVVDGLAAEPETDWLVYSFSSFLQPTSLYKLGADTSFKSEPLILVDAGGAYNPEDFVVKAVEYPSYDGTMVPMFIVHKKGIVLDGNNPTLLYGYGGFGIEPGPYFSRTNLFWIERGGVYAVAGLRGGGEKGDQWHKGGMEEKKFQVFFDFEYAMRYLIREGYTRPEKLAIRGGSNGGLLVGAMITRVPSLFHCAIGQVGLYDMIRYHKFSPGELWIPEYGSSDNPAQTGYLLGYSPYHQVLPGVSYPASFILTAESDTRVHWSHSAKFVAALQASGKSRGPILFRLERQAGHGQGMNWSAVQDEVTMIYLFIFSQIGDPQK